MSYTIILCFRYRMFVFRTYTQLVQNVNSSERPLITSTLTEVWNFVSYWINKIFQARLGPTVTAFPSLFLWFHEALSVQIMTVLVIQYSAVPSAASAILAYFWTLRLNHFGNWNHEFCWQEYYRRRKNTKKENDGEKYTERMGGGEKRNRRELRKGLWGRK